MQYILITGTSSGIGYDLANHFLSKGYHVIGTVRNAADATTLKAQFPNSFYVMVYDVSDIEGLPLVVKDVVAILNDKPLLALINNAGIAVPGPLELLSNQEFFNQIDVNVLSVFRITNAFLPYLGSTEKHRSTPGRIINISSVSGLFNAPLNGAYSVSKHALESMTEVYRRELGLFGIKVSAIEPGPIKTPIWNKNKGVLKRFEHSHYGKYLVHADSLITKSETSALPTSKVVAAVNHALESKDPKPRYLVHKNRFLFFILSKVVPSSLMDCIIWKSLNKGKSNRPF